MSRGTTTRLTITVPADGVTEEHRQSGYGLFVESAPDDSKAGVPLIGFDSPKSDRIPAYSKTQIQFRFSRLFVTGTALSAGGILYISTFGAEGISITAPNKPR
jgi:hypothetical protein